MTAELDDPIAAIEYEVEIPARQRVSQRPPAALGARSPQEMAAANPRWPESAGAFQGDGTGGYIPADSAPVRVVHDGNGRDAEMRDREYREACEREARLAPLVAAAEEALAALPAPEREHLARRALAEIGARL